MRLVLLVLAVVMIGCQQDIEAAKGRADVQRMAAKACIDRGGIPNLFSSGDYKDCTLMSMKSSGN